MGATILSATNSSSSGKRAGKQQKVCLRLSNRFSAPNEHVYANKHGRSDKNKILWTPTSYRFRFHVESRVMVSQSAEAVAD
jgi:hypothetical protein